MHPPDIIELTPVGITAEAYTDNPEIIPEGHIDDRFMALYGFDKGLYGSIHVSAASADAHD